MTKKLSQACTNFFRHPAQYSVSQSTSLLTWSIFIKTSGILIRSHTNLCGFLSFPKIFIQVYIMQEAATLISILLFVLWLCSFSVLRLIVIKNCRRVSKVRNIIVAVSEDSYLLSKLKELTYFGYLCITKQKEVDW